MAKLTELTQAIRAAVDEIETNLAGIRKEIGDLKAEREIVQAAPVTKALALSRLDTKLDDLAAKFDADGALIDRLWRPELGNEPLGLIEIFISENYTAHNVENMLAALFGPTIKKALAARIDAEYKALAEQGIEPMGDEQRAHRLREIDERVAELEATEEAMRTEAAAAGIDLAPRDDVSAEAFLEFDAGDDHDAPNTEAA